MIINNFTCDILTLFACSEPVLTEIVLIHVKRDIASYLKRAHALLGVSAVGGWTWLALLLALCRRSATVPIVRRRCRRCYRRCHRSDRSPSDEDDDDVSQHTSHRRLLPRGSLIKWAILKPRTRRRKASGICAAVTISSRGNDFHFSEWCCRIPFKKPV